MHIYIIVYELHVYIYGFQSCNISCLRSRSKSAKKSVVFVYPNPGLDKGFPPRFWVKALVAKRYLQLAAIDVYSPHLDGNFIGFDRFWPIPKLLC